MSRIHRIAAIALAAMAGCAGQRQEAISAQQKPKEKERAVSENAKYPVTRREEIVDVLFGATVADPYRWLEDEKSEEVQRWMAAEDELARKELHASPGHGALMRRLRELYYVDSISAPIRRGNRYFYTRTHADKEKAVYYWREGELGSEQVLIDPNRLSNDGSVSVGVVVSSYDGKKVAYALKANNSDESTLHVMDVSTGKTSDIDVIEGAKYAHPSWTPSGDGFYYTWLPPLAGKVTVAERPGFAEVRFHRLGSDPKQDPVVHAATGRADTFISPSLSRDGHWLFVYIQHGWNSSDVYFRDMRQKATTWNTLIAGTDAQYNIEAWKDRFYIHTNEGAPRWRIFATDANRRARADWHEIVPESKEAVIEEVRVVGGHLGLTWMRNASSELELRKLDGRPLRSVSLPGLGASAGLIGNPEDDTAYYNFTSFTHAQQIFKTAIHSGETSLWAEVKVPVDPTPYTVEQVWFRSKDGTRVSMFLVHRKDLQKDGKTPFLLSGYGGFNVNLLPAFNAGLYVWLEAGGGFAVPNLRGGGEYGEAWHRAGMLHNKQNVFDDFIAAAQFLVDAGYTRPERLAIRGGSNGGLLMGAVVTQRPELFCAVACAVPLLDMVRYHKFGSGKTWIPEYGSADDEAGFRTLFSYSPYHHVKAGVHYPALLMLSADSDDRVDPMHARKMAALLQAANSDANAPPILLRIEKHAGHGGADLVKQAVEQLADTYAFLMKELDMKHWGQIELPAK